MKSYVVRGLIFNKEWERDPVQSLIKVDAKDKKEAMFLGLQQLRQKHGRIVKASSAFTVEECTGNKLSLNLELPWYKQNIYAVDVETTGFSPEKDRITEFGFSKYDPDSKTFSSPQSYVINEGKPIPQVLLDKKINDITNETLKGKPDFKELFTAEGLKDIFHNCIWISHNRFFDYGFIARTVQRHGIEVEIPPIVCSMELSKRTNLGQKNNKLQTIMKDFLEFEGEQSHRAGDDAMYAGKAFLYFARKNRDIIGMGNTLDFLLYFDSV